MKGLGVAAFICICEPGRKGSRCRCAGMERFRRTKRPSRATWDADFSGRSLLAGHDWSRLSSILRAAGALERLQMLALLAEKPSSHGDLKRLTGLQPGPLYHHLNCLRLAGLVKLERRDRYIAAQLGRRTILGLLALSELLKREPQGPG